MSLHEHIVRQMQQFIDAHDDCVTLMPSALAADAFAQYGDGSIEAHIAYGCLEHFKGIARKVLAGRYADEGEENAAYASQEELFSGHLQDRYPVPRKAGQEPQYKLRGALSHDERAWNVNLLRKSAHGRLAHADALEAEGMSDAAA